MLGQPNASPMLGGVVVEVVTLPTEDDTPLCSVTVIVGVDVTLTVILEISRSCWSSGW
jgi:hypothetical protein